MGDFNARHYTFGDSQCNENGEEFRHFVNNRSMTVYDTDRQTHVAGGRLDYVIGRDLVHGNVRSMLATELISDHFAIVTRYAVDNTQSPKTNRVKISIPPYLEHHFKSRIYDWYNDYTVTSVDKFSMDMTTVVTDYYNTWVCPKKTFKNSNSQRCKQPKWVGDPTLLREQKRVQELYDIYKQDNTRDNLIEFLKANKNLRELKTHFRNEHFEQFLQSINNNTSMSEVWKKINRISGKPTNTPQFHSPLAQADMLLSQWAGASKLSSLPTNIQDHLSQSKIARKFAIEIGCSDTDPSDFAEITEWELNNALIKGKASAPGEDGITYSVLRLIAQVPGNPLLHLYRLSLSQGILPGSWTRSLIIPIPKSNTDKYRPISLTSCVCKVLERIILNRLRYRLQGKLSHRLYGFLSGRSTQHCFAEYFSHSNPGKHTVFLDLKSAFDIANREVILEQLVSFGIRGKILNWIRMYLSNRSASVLFRGVRSSTSQSFELGTPQGGVLSPMLFNVLMHKLVADIPLGDGESIICYADDICVRASSQVRMQIILDRITAKAHECGLVISAEKTMALNPCIIPPPTFRIGDQELDICHKYKYLGVNVNDADLVLSLKKRLWERLKPLKVLVGREHGINVKLARLFYLAFIRSVVDYHALHLLQCKESEIGSLEVVQNEAMRIILGAPRTARIVNMRSELNLPSISDRIIFISTIFGVKALREPSYLSDFQKQLQHKITQVDVTNHTHARPLIHKISMNIIKLNVPISKIPKGRSIPPWKNSTLIVHLTCLPQKNRVHNCVLKQIALATVTEHTESMGDDAYECYADGSVQSGYKAGCACAVYKNGLLQHQVNMRIQNWASTTQTELAGILLATEFLMSRGSGVVFCDSQSALRTLNSFKAGGDEEIVSCIKRNVTYATERNFNIQFVWIPSHVGIRKHDHVDKLAKEACSKDIVNIDLGMPLARVAHILKSSHKEELVDLINTQRPESCTIRHYDQYRDGKPSYGWHRSQTRQCDVVIARIRLGYRMYWQLHGARSADESRCRLCNEENKRTLEHYISECHVIQPFRPPNMRYKELCEYFISSDTLEDILVLYPKFTM